MREEDPRQIRIRKDTNGNVDPIKGKSGKLHDIIIEPASVVVNFVCHGIGEEPFIFDISLDGPTRTTEPAGGKAGSAVFASIIPGSYTIEILPREIEAEFFEATTVPKFSVASGEEKVVDVEIRLLAEMDVKVVSADRDEILSGASIEPHGPHVPAAKKQPDDAPAEFKAIAPGAYEIRINLPEDLAGTYPDPPPWPVTIPGGRKTEVVIKIHRHLRVLLWNIGELGGGFYGPEVRPEFFIDAYATIISRLNINVCLLLGLSQFGPPRMIRNKMKDGSTCYIPSETEIDAGTKEARRIVTSLSNMDSSGKWDIAFLTAGGSESIAYQAGQTAGVIYKDDDYLKIDSVELVRAFGDRGLGIPEELLCAHFDLTGPVEHDRIRLAVAAPLTSSNQGKRSSVETGGEDNALIEPEKDLPSSCLVAISSPHEISGSLKDLSARFGAGKTPDAPDLEYQTLPDLPYWEAVNSSAVGLLENPVAAAWEDPALQDESMHWDALTLPCHPHEPAAIKGALSDYFLCRRPSTGRVIILNEMRVVDLVRASLEGGKTSSAEDSKGSEDGASEPAEEDGILVELCRKYIEAMSGQSNSEQTGDAVMEIARSLTFVRSLSDHWPVLASINFSNVKKSYEGE